LLDGCITFSDTDYLESSLSKNLDNASSHDSEPHNTNAFKRHTSSLAEQSQPIRLGNALGDCYVFR
jgi:hypothetical protein